MDQLICIKASILGNSDWQLSESFSISLNGKGFLSLDSFGKGFTSNSHGKLRVSSSVDDLLVLNSLNQDTKSIMERSLSLVKDVLAGSSEHNGAGFISFTS